MIIIIKVYRHYKFCHVYLAIHLYWPSLFLSSLDEIKCRHRVDECKFTIPPSILVQFPSNFFSAFCQRFVVHP